MKVRALLSLSFVAVCAWSTGAYGVVSVFDDFEVNEGHFALQPSFSGTTTGIVAASSTADRVTDVAFAGTGSQKLVITDDPAVDVPSSNPVLSWRVRHLSGSGSAANNVSFTTQGYIGYYLRTTTPGLKVSLTVDDTSPTAHETAPLMDAIADGQWHLYEWDLDSTGWGGFAGTVDGSIGAASATLDSLWFVMPKGGATGALNAEFWIDNVSHNPDGHLPPVPEPATLALLAIGAALIRRRRMA